MKITITQAGWAGYTGMLGSVDFKDGVSVDDVGAGEVRALAAIVTVEEIDTGKNPSIAQVILDNRAVRAEVKPSSVEGTPAAPAPGRTYTEAALAQIADDSGIKGIREVATPLGLKGNSIAELIGKILGAQKPEAPAAEPVAEAPVEAVAEGADSVTGGDETKAE